MKASVSTGDCSRDLAVAVRKDNANQGGDESDSDSDSLESAANSIPESATGDCLSCSDTKQAAVKSAHKKFHKKVWASCSLAKWDLWKEAQLGQIGDCCQTMWGVTMKSSRQSRISLSMRTTGSFEVNKLIVLTNQLLKIKDVTHVKLYPCEHKAKIHGREKTLVQSLKYFHAHFYQLYEKGTTCAMVSLQGLHSGDALRCSKHLCWYGV